MHALSWRVVTSVVPFRPCSMGVSATDAAAVERPVLGWTTNEDASIDQECLPRVASWACADGE